MTVVRAAEGIRVKCTRLATALFALYMLLPDVAMPAPEVREGGMTTNRYREEMRARGQPVVLRMLKPIYPTAMRTAGCVVIDFQIGKDGLADKFVILNSIPPGVFDKAATDALFHWRFEPQDPPRRAVQPFSFGSGFERGLSSYARGPWPKECDVPIAHWSKLAARVRVQTTTVVAPFYPPQAVKSHTLGCVSISFVISGEGVPDLYRAESTEPAGVFDQSALWALNQWRFEPPGKPVPAAVTFGFGFRSENNTEFAPCFAQWSAEDALRAATAGQTP